MPHHIIGSGATALLRKVFAVLLLSGTMVAAWAAGSDVGHAASVWREFRATHIFHSDLIGITEPNSAGERVLIIAEPPPRTTLARIRQALGPYASNVQAFSHEVMHGGTVTDVAATLKPSIDSDALVRMTQVLHETLFGTARRAGLVQLPVEAPRIAGPSLDLHVSAYELEQFLFADSSKLSANPLDAPLPLRALLGRQARGVFRSDAKAGLAVWMLPRNGDISSLTDQVREFAYTTDIVLGSVADASTVGIVARLRQNPVQRLPPLRNETIQLLAAVEAKNVSQSYERTMWPSGRSADSFDRAPIYLTAQLRDTEYGSLLNIVDQLLKGWSEAGQIAYKDFKYAKPRTFPFGTARASSTDPDRPDGFLFNWNTEGIFYTSTNGDVEIVALNRTGSLPVIYGSTKERRVDTEARGYNYFASSGDANIARVVQYASVFAIFKRYGITSNWLASGASPDATTAVLVKASRAALEVLLSMHADAVTWNKVRADLSRSRRLAVFLTTVEAVLTEMANSSAEERSRSISLYAKLLGDPRGERFKLARYVGETLRSKSAVPDDTANARRAMQVVERASAIEAVLSESQYGSYIADKIGLWDAMETVAERQGDGWIQTAAVVASKDVANNNAVGGHNIDASMISMRSEPALEQGKVLLRRDKSGEVLVFYSPADRARVASLSRKLSELNGKTLGEAEDALGQVVRAARAEVRPIDKALALDILSAADKADYNLAMDFSPNLTRGTASLANSMETALILQHRPTVIVRRLADHYEVSSTESNAVLSIGNAATLQQVLVDQARAGGFQTGQAHIILTGFGEKTEPLLGSVKSRMARAGVDSEAMFVTSEAKHAEFLLSKHQWASAEIDRAGITTRLVESGAFKGATEMTIPVRLKPAAAGKPSLLVRFVLYFKNKLDEATKSAIATKVLMAFKTLSADLTLADATARLKVILKRDGVDLANFEVRTEADDILITQNDSDLVKDTTA